jgi:uncharacterized membrane protein (UPF0127 family)
MKMGKSKGFVSVQSLKNQCLIADKCFVANRFFARLKGLIGTTRLESGEGIFLSPCNDIHMWFMSIPIDVVFVRAEAQNEAGDTHDRWKVCSVHEDMRPWKLLPLRDGRATDTLELPVGTIRRCAIAEGDLLCLS